MARHFRYASHAQVLEDHPAFTWDAVLDPDESSLERVRERWPSPRGVRRLDDLQDPGSFDVAVLAIPPGRRAELVEALPGLRAVIVEKPLGEDLREAEHFLEICRNRGILVQVNLIRRGDLGLTRLMRERSRTLGSVQAASGYYGNGLVNNGSHLVDLIRMVVGEVEWVQAIGGVPSILEGPLPGDANIAFSLRCTNGAPVMVQPISQTNYREFSLDLWGTGERLAIAQGGLEVLEYRRREHRALGGDHEIVSDEPIVHRTALGDALFTLYTNLGEALDGTRELLSPGESGLRTARVVEAIRRSFHQQGARVTLDGFTA